MRERVLPLPFGDRTSVIPFWSTGGVGAPATMLIPQSDSNLVLYAAGAARWSITQRNALAPGESLESSGRLVSSDGRLVLTLQAD